MKLTTLLTTQNADGAGVARVASRPQVTPRPYGIGTGIGSAMGIGIRNVCTASWTATSRKPMLVPTFHDRWPLCSTT